MRTFPCHYPFSECSSTEIVTRNSALATICRMRRIAGEADVLCSAPVSMYLLAWPNFSTVRSALRLLSGPDRFCPAGCRSRPGRASAALRVPRDLRSYSMASRDEGGHLSTTLRAVCCWRFRFGYTRVSSLSHCQTRPRHSGAHVRPISLITLISFPWFV